LTLKKRQAEVEGLYGELDATVAAYTLEKKLRKHRDMIFMMTRQRGMLRKAEERAYMDRWADFLMECDVPDDFWGRNYYFDGLGLYWRFVGDHDKCFASWTENKQLWLEKDHFQQSFSTTFLVFLNNYLAGLFHIGSYDLLKSEAEKFWILQFFRILYAMNVLDFEHGKAVALKIESQGPQYAHKLIKATSFSLYTNIAVLFLASGDPSSALQWNNKVLADPKIEQGENIRRLSLLLQLPIHYDLENFDVLSGLVDTVKRNLERNRELTINERSILSFFSDLYSCLPGKESQQLKRMKDWLTKNQGAPINEMLQYWMGNSKTNAFQKS